MRLPFPPKRLGRRVKGWLWWDVRGEGLAVLGTTVRIARVLKRSVNEGEVYLIPCQPCQLKESRAWESVVYDAGDRNGDTPSTTRVNMTGQGFFSFNSVPSRFRQKLWGDRARALAAPSVPE